MINRTVLTGRITKDLSLKSTQSGTKNLSFTLAVKRQYVKEGQQDTDFINCVAWNRTAETMAQYLHKGSLIGIDGRIQTRSYDNQQGQRVYVTEVVCENFTFLVSRNSTSESKPQPNQTRNDYEYSPEPIDLGLGDDIPF